MPTPFSRIAIAGALSLMACLGACGTEKAKPKPQGRSYGHVELSFIKAAQDSQIPVRILLAVGMTESSLTPNKQSASYPGLVLGSSLTETAFGVSRKKLGFKEGEGDTLLRKGLEELVADRADTFNLVRWKEIYEYLEVSTDRIEDISDILQRLLIKNA